MPTNLRADVAIVALAAGVCAAYDARIAVSASTSASVVWGAVAVAVVIAQWHGAVVGYGRVAELARPAAARYAARATYAVLLFLVPQPLIALRLKFSLAAALAGTAAALIVAHGLALITARRRQSRLALTVWRGTIALVLLGSISGVGAAIVSYSAPAWTIRPTPEQLHAEIIPPDGVRRITIDGETRRAHIVSADSPVQFPVRVEQNAVMQMAIGRAKNAPRTPSVHVTVEFTSHTSESQRLAAYDVSTLDGAWRDVSFPVDALHDELGYVRVHIRSRGESASAPEGFPFIAVTPPRQTQTAASPNILLILIDTLRYDHLDLYGYDRETAPCLAREAARPGSVVFTNAVAPSSWTTPSTASLLTSLMPSRHGADSFAHLALTPRAETLAERLRAAGYSTAGVSANVQISESRFFDQGFDRFYSTPLWTYFTRSTEFVHARALSYLRQVPESLPQPFFLYLHYYDPHDPYIAPPPYTNGPEPTSGWDDFASVIPGVLWRMSEYDVVRRAPPPEELGPGKLRMLVDRYDGEVRYVDESVCGVLAELDARGLRESTLVIVTSDHGEEFMEHGDLRHARTLYDEVLRVPLLVQLPRSLWEAHPPPSPANAPVMLTDVGVTVLDYLGLPGGETLDGWSFRDLVDGAPGAKWDSRDRGGELLEPWRRLYRMRSWRQGEWVFLRRTRNPDAPAYAWESVAVGRDLSDTRELYNLARDPGQRTNVIADNAARARAMEHALDAYFADMAPLDPARRDPAGIAPDHADELRAIGYLE